MYQEIELEINDPVAIIRMNRPDRLNAMTTHMLAELRHAFAAAEADPGVVGIVLTGAGRGFCAGMDIAALDEISTMASRPRPETRPWARTSAPGSLTCSRCASH